MEGSIQDTEIKRPGPFSRSGKGSALHSGQWHPTSRLYLALLGRGEKCAGKYKLSVETGLPRHNQKNRDHGLLSLISGHVKRQSRHEQLVAQAVVQITEQGFPSHPSEPPHHHIIRLWERSQFMKLNKVHGGSENRGPGLLYPSWAQPSWRSGSHTPLFHPPGREA